MAQSHITAQDLYRIAQVSDPQFSPDGRRIAYVQTEMDEKDNVYRSAIWLVPAEGGPPRKFTSGTRRDTCPRWSPDGRWLAFLSTRGAEKAKAQVYLMPTDGGEAHCLLEMENGAADLAWSPAGSGPSRLAFTSRLDAKQMAAEDEPKPDEDGSQGKESEEKAPDPRIISRFTYRAETDYLDERTKHLYVVDVDLDKGQVETKPRRLTDDARNYASPRWMPDGTALVASVDRLPGTDDLFYYPDVVRVPLDGGAVQILTGPETADHNPWPSPDGRWIAYNSLPAAEYTTANGEIQIIPAEGGEPKVLTAELDAHAREMRWLPDGQGLCFLVSEQGRIDLRRVSIDGGPVETLLSAEREMMAYDLAADGTKIAFTASTDRSPWDLYVAQLGGQATRLTEVNGEWLAGRRLGSVEDLWFESADGTAIQGWLVKPPDFDAEKRYPLVLSIHGGPHVMWSRHEPTMWHEWQVLAGSGYVVLACNPRGSDGYGREFRAALLNRWGEADLPDLMAGVEAVLGQGFVDPERLVVTGGSYGGFMTAWVVGHENRFKAAVAQRGVYDLISFYSTSDVPRLTEWEFSTLPWEDPMLMWKYSPLAYVENIHTPLLLIHSENDFRAPIPAAEGLFVALRRLKREVIMVRYPRDGHELSRSGEPAHRVDRLERIVEWFDRYVQQEEPEPGAVD